MRDPGSDAEGADGEAGDFRGRGAKRGHSMGRAWQRIGSRIGHDAVRGPRMGLERKKRLESELFSKMPTDT